MKIEQFDGVMKEKGWVLLEAVVPEELVLRMANELQSAYLHCRSLQERNGISTGTEYTVHHLIGQGESFFEYLEAQYIHPYLTHCFSGAYILNSFGGTINSRNSENYAHRIHRDVRTFTHNFPLLINTLVMLDNFTSENGATLVLSGSHHAEEKPDEKFFYDHAEQVIGPAGSILIFDSNVWHAAAHNQTNTPRRSVTPMYSRPFIKQQFDYPRALGNEFGEMLKEEMRQLIGYNSRVPASLDEWYQPPEKRMYKPGQG